MSQVINEDCNVLLEKAQRADFSTGMPRQGQVNILNNFFGLSKNVSIPIFYP